MIANHIDYPVFNVLRIQAKRFGNGNEGNTGFFFLIDRQPYSEILFIGNPKRNPEATPIFINTNRQENTHIDLMRELEWTHEDSVCPEKFFEIISKYIPKQT